MLYGNHWFSKIEMSYTFSSLALRLGRCKDASPRYAIVKQNISDNIYYFAYRMPLVHQRDERIVSCKNVS